MSAGTVRAYRCGGIRLEPRRRPPCWLSSVDREELSRGMAAGVSARQIAVSIGPGRLAAAGLTLPQRSIADVAAGVSRQSVWAARRGLVAIQRAVTVVIGDRFRWPTL